MRRSSSLTSPSAVVITVGNELLSGRTVDTNAAWLGRFLSDRLGIEVDLRLTVGDEQNAIATAVAQGMARAEIVIVTGGLGPTPDDLTREAVARALNRPLLLDQGLLDQLTGRFRSAGRPLPDANRRIAMVPWGAQLLSNPLGTAPGLLMDEQGIQVVLLPGVPREMNAIASEAAAEALRRVFAGRLPDIRSRELHTTGVPESALAGLIGDAFPSGFGGVRLAFLPEETGVDLRLTVTGGTASVGRLDEAEAQLREVVKPWLFEAPETGDLAEAVLTALRTRGLRLAAAESCTGGLASKRLTDVAGASDVFLGGVVAYSDDAKEALLGVERKIIDSCGAVSEEVAEQMARGALMRFGAEVAVSLTGIAGPGGATPDKPVGTVCFAAVHGDQAVVRRSVFPGNRDGVRQRSAQAALALILHLVDGRLTPPLD